MKRKREKHARTLSRFLERFFSPSSEQIQSGRDRVLQRLHTQARSSSERTAEEPESSSSEPKQWKLRVALAAASVMLVIASSVIVWRMNQRTNHTNIVPPATEQQVEQTRQILRSSVGKDMLTTLSDGSRVEMRGGSEASVEDAIDGLRIRLNAGSIIVNAAKQAPGRHLYVATRDVLVSVVGTVFFVNADDKGSRVSVIQGEVRVQQGTMEKNLRPGEQVSSNPKVKTPPVTEQIGWSRDAAAYLAMLHQELAQSLAARPSSQSPTSVPDRTQFEAASVKPCPQDFRAPEGARGGGSGSMRLSPGRLDALCMTVATLIRTAYRPLRNNSVMPGDQGSLHVDSTYGLGRENGTSVRGGPDWVRSEKYTIAAVAASPVDAGTLQRRMLLNLLETRFQLKMHVELEPISAFALTIAKSGLKMKHAGLESCTRNTAPTGPMLPDPLSVFKELESIRRGEPPQCGHSIRTAGPNVVQIGGATSIGSLAQLLSVASQLAMSEALNGLLVLDRTGIPETDTFNFVLQYAGDQGVGARFGIPPEIGADTPKAPSVFDALEQQLGLKLERIQSTREFVVIDHIEKPEPN